MGRARALNATAAAGLLIGAVLLGSRGNAEAAASAGLVLQPPQGPPNSTVSFVGSGFCSASSCGAVTVSFDNVTVAYPVHVQADGSISGAFLVPSGPNGYQRVVASQPVANRSATALFFVGTALPPPTGPQPTVSYTPPEITPPSVHSTQPLSSITTPPTATTSSSSPTATPASGDSASNSTSSPHAAHSSSSSTTWWWIALPVLAAMAVAGVITALVRRRGRQAHNQ